MMWYMNKGNGTEQKGNSIANKGNTIEKSPFFLFPQAIRSLFFSYKGNAKRATLTWRLL